MSPHRLPILFASYPENGLINPMLVLAGELSRRGVADLWFATDEYRRADVDALNVVTPVEFISLGEVTSRVSPGTWDDETYRQATQRSRVKAYRAVVRHTTMPALQIEKYRRLEAAAEEIRPALMVIESTCQEAWELAIARGIPFVLSVPFLPSTLLGSRLPFVRSYTPRNFPAPHSGLPFRMTLGQRLANRLFRLRRLTLRLSPTVARLSAREDRVRAQLGLAPLVRSSMAEIDAADMILCYSVPELDYPLRVPDKLRFVGAVIPPLPEAREDGGLSDWLDCHQSVIYMSFGTITRFTREQVGTLVDVARRLAGRHQILWKLPVDQQTLLPPRGTLPGNLRIETWVPSHLDILAHPNVRAYFTNGGPNGFHECVYFGKPLVIRPLTVYCFDQAVRGEDFGVSLTLARPETFDPDDVVDKLTRVLDDDTFRMRAAHFGQLQWAAGGRRAATDLLLALPALARRRPGGPRGVTRHGAYRPWPNSSVASRPERPDVGSFGDPGT